MIFDDPAELYDWQRPPFGSWEGKLSNPRGRAARTRCMNFFPKIYEIPRTATAREPCVDFAAAKNTVVTSSRAAIAKVSCDLAILYNLRGKSRAKIEN